jgi:HK97 family phage major capsid protein
MYEKYLVHFDGEDLEAERFRKNSHFWLDYMQPKAIMFNHLLDLHPLGMDIEDGKLTYEEVPAECYLVGEIHELEIDEKGIKARYTLYDKLPEHIASKFDFWNKQIEAEHAYWLGLVQQHHDAGKLGFSTDSIKALITRKAGEDGVTEITSWPMPYVSLTHIAAEPRNTLGNQLESTHIDQQKSADSETNPDITNNNLSGNLTTNPDLDKENIMEMKEDVKNEEMIEEEEVKMVDEDEETAKDASVSATDILNQLATILGGVSPQIVGTANAESAESAPVEAKATADQDVAEASASGQDETIPTTKANTLISQVAGLIESAGRNTGAGRYMTSKNVNVNLTAPLGDEPQRFLKAIRLVRDGKATPSNLKALGLVPSSAGGFLTQTEQSNELIDLLLARSIFMRGGDANRLVDLYPMASDTMTVPVHSSGGTAYWTAENSSITTSQDTFAQRTLVAKKLAMLIPISNELLADSSIAVEAKIREAMVRIMYNAVDKAILAGAGINGEPTGLRNTPGITITDINGVPTYDNLIDAIERLEAADVELDDSVAWVFRPREKATFRKMENTEGQLIFTQAPTINTAATGGDPSELVGYPYIASNNVQLGLGDNSASESDIYLARWSDVIVGLRQDIEIQASNVAGTAFQNDQTWLRAILRMDVAVGHTEAVEILEGIQS